MAETNSASYTFFLPILILIVIQLAKVAQDAEVSEFVSNEHSPLLISPVVGVVFATIRWIIIGLTSAVILKLLSDSLEARLQAWYYERLTPLLEPFRDAQIELLERISGEQLDDNAEIVQLLTQIRKVPPKLLPGPMFLILPRKPDPELPRKQIDSVNQYRVKMVDYIYALESRLVPDLGRFLFIHAASSVLLLLGLVFSITLLSGSFKQISILITVLVWIILPVFELDEYDNMLSEDIVVYSFPAHILNVLILVLVVLGVGKPHRILLPVVELVIKFQYSGRLSYILVTISFIFTIWVFASTLETELQKTSK